MSTMAKISNDCTTQTQKQILQILPVHLKRRTNLGITLMLDALSSSLIVVIASLMNVNSVVDTFIFQGRYVTISQIAGSELQYSGDALSFWWLDVLFLCRWSPSFKLITNFWHLVCPLSDEHRASGSADRSVGCGVLWDGWWWP
jgi:hypothetical protein